MMLQYKLSRPSSARSKALNGNRSGPPQPKRVSLSPCGGDIMEAEHARHDPRRLPASRRPLSFRQPRMDGIVTTLQDSPPGRITRSGSKQVSPATITISPPDEEDEGYDDEDEQEIFVVPPGDETRVTTTDVLYHTSPVNICEYLHEDDDYKNKVSTERFYSSSLGTCSNLSLLSQVAPPARHHDADRSVAYAGGDVAPLRVSTDAVSPNDASCVVSPATTTIQNEELLSEERPLNKTPTTTGTCSLSIEDAEQAAAYTLVRMMKETYPVEESGGNANEEDDTKKGTNDLRRKKEALSSAEDTIVVATTTPTTVVASAGTHCKKEKIIKRKYCKRNATWWEEKTRNSKKARRKSKAYTQALSTSDYTTAREQASTIKNTPKPAPRATKTTSKVDEIPTQSSPTKQATTTASSIANDDGSSVDGMRLATPGDHEHLNSLHCFVRAELLEVCTLKSIPLSPSSQPAGYISSPPRRVGFRCIFCGNKSRNERTESSMSAFFPKSLKDIYRGVCTWQRIHFKSCLHTPDHIKKIYWTLKDTDRTRGKKSHWVKSAYQLGLRDADTQRSGIIWSPKNDTSEVAFV